jgi:uncharacterized protein YabE (DUF348 family)
MKKLPVIIIVLCSLGVVALIWYYFKSSEKATVIDPNTGVKTTISTKPKTLIDILNEDRG